MMSSFVNSQTVIPGSQIPYIFTRSSIGRAQPISFGYIPTDVSKKGIILEFKNKGIRLTSVDTIYGGAWLILSTHNFVFFKMTNVVGCLLSKG